MINTDLLVWFNSGIGIGFVILTTLCCFRNSVKENGKDSSSEADDDRKTRQTIESTQPSPSTGDDVDQGQYAFTPYQKMNFAVYIILFLIAAVILDREYGGMLCVWLRFYFPREAAILGYTPVVERQP